MYVCAYAPSAHAKLVITYKSTGTPSALVHIRQRRIMCVFCGIPHHSGSCDGDVNVWRCMVRVRRILSCAQRSNARAIQPAHYTLHIKTARSTSTPQHSTAHNQNHRHIRASPMHRNVHREPGTLLLVVYIWGWQQPHDVCVCVAVFCMRACMMIASTRWREPQNALGSWERIQRQHRQHRVCELHQSTRRKTPQAGHVRDRKPCSLMVLATFCGRICQLLLLLLHCMVAERGSIVEVCTQNA